MKYLSLFSGIEAASVAWDPIGWEAVGFAEFEDFPKAVLAHRYPGIPDLGDVTKITEEQIIALGPFDILVGGSPCQDLSIAGHRAGMKNEDGSTTRSGLFDEQMRIFEIARKHNGARYLLWENVPGAFSSNYGWDFAYVLETLVGGSFPIHERYIIPTEVIDEGTGEWVNGGPKGKRWTGGYKTIDKVSWEKAGVIVSGNGRCCVEWRVLDAQYFGVPQRRRRIFALLDTGAWWSRSPILFEQDSEGRDSQESREEGEGIAEGTGEGVEGECNTYAVRTAQTGANGIGVAKEVAHTLDCANGQAVCIPLDMRNANRKNDVPGHECGSGIGKQDDPVNTIATCFIPAVCIYENHPNDSRVTRCDDGICPTLSSRMGTGGGNIPFIMSSGQANAEINGGGICPTLNCLHEAPILVGEDNE